MSKQYRWPLDTSRLTFGDGLALYAAQKADAENALRVFARILTKLAGVDVYELPYADAPQFFSESAEQITAYFQTMEVQPVRIELPAAFRAAFEDIDDLDDDEEDEEDVP